jgi:hypothetical protein
MIMTLVRGLLVGLLCMPVLLVGCGADPGTVGDDAGNPGDMLDSSANAGPTQHELELGRRIVQQYTNLMELRDPVTALEALDFRDMWELAGLPREEAPNFMLAVGEDRSLMDCLTVDQDEISLTSCPVGPVNVSAFLKLNFQTFTLELGVDGTLSIGEQNFNIGADMGSSFTLDDHSLDAVVSTGVQFHTLTAGIELAMIDLALEECGPSAGSLTFTIELGDQSLPINLPFLNCGG